MQRSRQEKAAKAGLLRLVLPWALAAAMPAPAAALELFGLTLFGSGEEEVAVADPVRYDVTLTVEGDDAALTEALEEASLLVQEEDKPVSGSLGVIARARDDRERLVAALYREARYDGVVEVAIEGRPIDAIPPDAVFSAEPVPVTVTVTPGPLYRLGAVRLAGDAAGLDPADFGLSEGGPAGSAVIFEAESEIVRVLKEQGRPLAKVAGREVVADHPTQRLSVTLELAAGPVAPFGATSVTGTETVDPGFTAYMAGIEPGRTFSPDEVEAARERLADLGVFSRVTVKEADALAADGSIPVSVDVTERKHRYLGIGATLSNTEGLGLEGYWGHRNLFGRAEKLRIEGSISRIGDTSEFGKLNYNAGIMFEKPGVLGPASKFFASTRVVSEHPDAYDRFSARAGAGFEYEVVKDQTASAELAVEWSDVEDVLNPDGVRHLLVSVPLQYVIDKRDDRLDPKEGYRLLAYGEPTYDIETGASFVKLRGEASAYLAVDEARRFVFAGRVAGGSIFGAALADIPADRRFYAGGGGSVRGYAYQGVGPRLDGTPTGGRSYAEASLEMRFGVTDTIGIVPFIDVGTVSAAQFPDFSDVKAGAGIGLRYLTPFGPLRVDVAVPLNRDPEDPRYGIYAGIGQSF